MKSLSKYSDAELREELDRRTRKVMNANGRVRCKDCILPNDCRANRGIKKGVWRICTRYTAKDNN